MLSVTFSYWYAECHYADCRNAECPYAECRGTLDLSIFSLPVPMAGFELPILNLCVVCSTVVLPPLANALAYTESSLLTERREKAKVWLEL
jgi:hypothetical protein